jgi:hypothetical protein
MKRSIDRILTTHCGSLARPKDLLDLMKAKLTGESYDQVQYANRITGAGADCGFSSQATYEPEVHPKIVLAKFQAMAEGARLATKQLWR